MYLLEDIGRKLRGWGPRGVKIRKRSDGRRTICLLLIPVDSDLRDPSEVSKKCLVALAV